MAAAGALIHAARALLRQYSLGGVRRILHKPVFIVSAPRAGSTLLFETLMRMDGIWTIGGESHGVLHAFPHLRGYDEESASGVLRERHATAETVDLLPACFLALLRDHRGEPYMARPAERRPSQLTMLEKTPRNALNIPFLRAVFPDARFIYLYRDPRENIASLIEAWQTGLETGRFVTFRDLPGWDRDAWCFLLPPGWPDLVGRTLPEIAAFQWTASNDAILGQIEGLGDTRCVTVSYRQLADAPAETLLALCRFAGVEPQPLPRGPLPLSRTSLSPPHPDKWRKHQRVIDELWPSVAPTWQRIEELQY